MDDSTDLTSQEEVAKANQLLTDMLNAFFFVIDR